MLEKYLEVKSAAVRPRGGENVDVGFCELQCAFDGVTGSCAVDCAYETCCGR